MRVRWLLPSVLGAIVLCFSSPAEAARLQSWRFDADENRLTFTTDEGIQPRAQLVANPTRLVIDLPDTTLGLSQVEEMIGDAIRAVRIGQFDATTTRIVIELNPGYTLDPERVRVRGTTASQWVVELPEPELIDRSEADQAEADRSEADQTEADQPEAIAETPEAAAILEEVQITPDGFFVRLNGEPEDVDEDNDRSPRRRFTLELEDTALSAQVVQREIELNRYGVERIELTQIQGDRNDPPEVRITLELEADSPRWRSLESDYGGIVLVPREGDVLTDNRETQSLTSAATPSAAALPVPDQPIPVPRPDAPAPAPVAPAATIPLPDVSDRRVVVAIDPGHGGRDPGAVGIDGLQEAGIVLDIGLQVADLLEQQGVAVILTRQDDREIDLEPRVRAANQGRANLFVSIHANAISLSRPDVNGIETYYYSDAGARLARVMHDTMVEMTSSRDRGVRSARFYVLRHTSMPAVLLEVGFVTGEFDAPRLEDPEFRSEMAEAIAAGILRYVQQNF
ncbi:MAG: hypothetical protein Kow00121_35240 [Elainellaceae cyanobacterium]